jgi:hypothetical protein
MGGAEDKGFGKEGVGVGGKVSGRFRGEGGEALRRTGRLPVFFWREVGGCSAGVEAHRGE